MTDIGLLQGEPLKYDYKLIKKLDGDFNSRQCLQWPHDGQIPVTLHDSNLSTSQGMPPIVLGRVRR